MPPRLRKLPQDLAQSNLWRCSCGKAGNSTDPAKHQNPCLYVTWYDRESDQLQETAPQQNDDGDWEIE